jgi:hypothetical protein
MNAVRRVGRSGRYILGEQVQTTESGSRLVGLSGCSCKSSFCRGVHGGVDFSSNRFDDERPALGKDAVFTRRSTLWGFASMKQQFGRRFFRRLLMSEIVRYGKI